MLEHAVEVGMLGEGTLSREGINACQTLAIRVKLEIVVWSIFPTPQYFLCLPFRVVFVSHMMLT